jgi:hypothetical protein
MARLPRICLPEFAEQTGSESNIRKYQEDLLSDSGLPVPFPRPLSPPIRVLTSFIDSPHTEFLEYVKIVEWSDEDQCFGGSACEERF